MRFRVACALGGGLATWMETEGLKWSELTRLWGYVRYAEKCEEARRGQASMLPYLKQDKRAEYLRGLKRDLEAAESEQGVRAREGLREKLQEMNRRIRGG